MKKFDALQRHLLTLALAALPVATLVLDQLDQSTRRPSVARALLHSLQLAF